MLVAIHFVFGLLSVVVVPAFIYRGLRAQLPTEAGVAFGVAGLLLLAFVFWVAKILNGYFEQTSVAG